jgi:hypothetical protein
MIKTTKKHFDTFCKECVRWVRPLGLVGWEIYFLWERQKDFAIINDDHKNKYAVITFTKTWDDRVARLNNNAIKKTAFHEMMELKLGKLRGKQEYIHEIIYTIENLLGLNKNDGK